MNIRSLWLPAIFFATLAAHAADPATVKVTPNLAYKTGDKLTPYETERCRLDVYAPADARDLPCLVWFHGGGLTEGQRDAPPVAALCRALASEGMVVASASYRLSPRVKYPAYIEDAAAAVAWMRGHSAEYGGDPGLVFVGGHSAGGYLAQMLGTDEHYLDDAGVKETNLAGFIPLSGQAMTHFTVRQEQGLPKNTLTADGAAPINHVRKDTPPWLILYAEHDMEFRAAEDRFFADALREVGNPGVTIREEKDRTHGSIADWISHPGDPVRAQIVEWVRQTSEARRKINAHL